VLIQGFTPTQNVLTTAQFAGDSKYCGSLIGCWRLSNQSHDGKISSL